jgi:3-deoxy-7-phosphoheptulonate synthase/chorismate mutase
MTQVSREIWSGKLEQVDQRLRELVAERSAIVAERHRMAMETGGASLGREEQEREKRLLADIVAAFQPAEASAKKPLLVSRKHRNEDTIVTFGGIEVGGGARPVVVAGPCSVESYEQTRTVAEALAAAGVSVMRGGAFKPRTSPYDFQGLGVDGLKILKEAAAEFGLRTISEIVDPRHLELACDYIDVIQIGARNMHNFELLKEAGKVGVPILLKRGLAATVEEFLHAAEYIVAHGNPQVMLIERGIRTYEKATRNTLDISAVPLIKRESHLPILVDVTHSTGVKSILAPCAKAALAAGADGVMVEVHPDPANALSDSAQQLDLGEFAEFYAEVKRSGLLR